MVQLLWKTVVGPQKLKHKSTVRPNNVNSGYISKMIDLKGIFVHPCSLKYCSQNGQNVEATQVSTNR
jgi:hypothetical protein